MSSNELSEQMAYDLTKDKKWVEDYHRKQRFRAYMAENPD